MINDREFRLILPKWTNSGRRIKPEEIKSFALKMSDHFGGVSVVPNILGCWRNKNKIQCEENTIISSARDSETTPNFEQQIIKDRQFMQDMAEEAGIKFGQEEVMISESKTEVDFKKGKFRKTLPNKLTGVDFFAKMI